MEKLKLSGLMLIALLVMFACKKHNDDPQPNPYTGQIEIVGFKDSTWQHTVKLTILSDQDFYSDYDKSTKTDSGYVYVQPIDGTVVYFHFRHNSKLKLYGGPCELVVIPQKPFFILLDSVYASPFVYSVNLQ